jgi:hypothetical protein
LRQTAAQYADIEFYYADAIYAMRKVLGLQLEKIDMDMKMIDDGPYTKMEVHCSNNIFGPQPFLALKTKRGEYHWDNFDFCGENKWCYTFDNNTLEMKDIEKIGIATNNASGVGEVIVYDVETNSKKKKILNETL